MDKLLQIGAQAFLSKLGSGQGGQLSLAGVVSALAGLLGNNKGKVDLGSLLSSLNGAGLADLAKTWLGDGTNSSLSADKVTQIFSPDKLSGFARQLGIGQDQAVSGLQEAIPAMVDKASSGGSLLDSLGGASGLLGMAKGLLNR